MKNFRIIVILLFGFLLTSTGMFACENNSVTHSSGKESSSKICNKDCCKKDNHSKNTSHASSCGGKCKHSKCGCVSFCNTSFSIIEWNNNDINRFNFSLARQIFYNYETTISSGFNSLWLIPKIG